MEFIKVPLAFTGVSQDFSALQLDALLLLIAAQKQGAGVVNRKDLIRYKIAANWHRFKIAIQSFILPSVVFDSTHLPLLAEFSAEKGRLNYKLYKGLEIYFYSENRKTFQFNLDDFFNLKSKYGKLLYFSGIRWFGTGKYSVYKIDLALNWCVKSTYLNNSSNFINRVIQPAIHDCFDNSGTYFHLSESKKDKRIESYLFELKHKTQLELFAQSPQIFEALKAIQGHLSEHQINYICRYLDEKAINKLLYIMNIARINGKIKTSPAAYFMGLVYKAFPIYCRGNNE